ncbi:protein-L-isoaspartate(D-aspartate) O-methyltransferase [Candidatus Micrarchaeota archaeon]|nr:protein-L-isoaspartate(D-aspartate) O-methyltransferase [Candidatus Micrarchaeota archaeon]
MSELELMVARLKSTGFLKGQSVEKAMLAIDRALFMSKEYLSLAYSDNAFPIGYDQTISAPTVVSFMLDKLEVKPGMKILEIGTGSGYNAALLSYIVGIRGKVISIELVPEICALARKNIAKISDTLPNNLTLLCEDGSEGWQKEAPYDIIIITAAMPELRFDIPFIKQLKKDGRLIAPVGNSWNQNLVLYDNKNRTTQRILPVMFVPLRGKAGFQNK